MLGALVKRGPEWKILLVGAALVATIGLLATAGLVNHRAMQHEALARAEHTAAALTQHALRTFRAQELAADFVNVYTNGLDWSQIRSSGLLQRLLHEVAETNDDIAGIFLIDPEGRVALSSVVFPTPAVDVSDRDYFHALRAGQRLYVSERTLGRLTNEPFFNLARRRSAPGDAFDGVITVSISPEYYESFYASFLAPQEVANLVRADGTILARFPPAPEEGVRLPSTAPLMQAIAGAGREGRFVASSSIDGIERVVAYRQVGALPVYATFQEPTAVLWAAWRRIMMPYTFASLLAFVGLLVAIRMADHRAQRALAEERHRDATEANRAKDLFIAAVSHEIRNPLAAIAMAADLLRKRPAQAAHAVDVISRQTRHAGAILDDLLDTARTVYGKLRLRRRRMDLHAAAQEVLCDRAEQPEAGVGFALRGEAAWVDADPVRLRQIIENLVENAVRYGGRHIALHVRRDGECNELAVEDDGEGIAPELLPRLFTPFVQGEQALERSRGGLGLGLALVSRLAQLHGGSIRAESNGRGCGSMFTLRLPAAEPPACLVEHHASDSSPQGRTRSILLVEDDADERETLRALLREAGHEVAVAAAGSDALAAFERAQPDVALLDIGLPGMDGYEIARRLRALRPARPLLLVAIDGYGRPHDAELARRAGFDAHLKKPFSSSELLAVICPPPPEARGVKRRS